MKKLYKVIFFNKKLMGLLTHNKNIRKFFAIHTNVYKSQFNNNVQTEYKKDCNLGNFAIGALRKSGRIFRKETRITWGELFIITFLQEN
jgi:hypothetical protein